VHHHPATHTASPSTTLFRSRHRDESAMDAALRELREEIGMTAHGSTRLAAELEQRPDRRRDLVSVVIVEDVAYAPRWSWEVERRSEEHTSELQSRGHLVCRL